MLRSSYSSEQKTSSYHHNNNSSSRTIQEKNSGLARASHLCQIDCEKEKKNPVCGMDNITYPSRCYLHQTLCAGKRVRLQYRGECSESKLCSS